MNVDVATVVKREIKENTTRRKVISRKIGIVKEGGIKKCTKS